MLYDVRFKTSVEAETLVADLRSALIHKEMTGLDHLLNPGVIEGIAFVDDVTERGEKNLTHLYPTLLDRVKQALKASEEELAGDDGTLQFSNNQIDGCSTFWEVYDFVTAACDDSERAEQAEFILEAIFPR